MKKIVLTLAVFCFLFFNCLGQSVIEWQKSFGGSGMDWGAFSSSQTNDGGFVLIGITDSNDGDVSGNHGDQDVWVVKLDATGNLEWQKCYGGDTSDVGTCIAQTSDGGYIAGGFTYSNNGDVSGNHGGADYWIVKMDSAGNIQWQKCFGGTAHEDVHSIEQTTDAGYIITGTTFSNNGDVSGLHGFRDYWVVKIDSIGSLQWQKCLGGTDDDFSHSVKQTFDGGYIVAGHTYSNDGDVTGNNGSVDYWIVKLSITGNIVWQKCFGGTNWENAYCIIQTSDSGYAVNGETTSNNVDVSGNHGAIDNWIIKLDVSGNLQWQKCLGGTGSDRGQYIQQTNDGGYIVTGNANSNDGEVSQNHGSGDFWIVKLDNAGNINWQNCFGGTGEDSPFTIQQISDGIYIAAGFTRSNNCDVTGNHGGYCDFWILKFADKFNQIKGRQYIDLNSNQVLDNGEPFPFNNKITETNTQRFTHSEQDGSYNLSVIDSGNFSVYPTSISYYNAVPANHIAYFSGINQTDSLNDFAFQPAGVFNDLCITITPMGNFRAGMNASYMINYENVGTTTLNATVIFFPDNDVTFVSANPIATSVTTDSVVWNVGTLTPFQTGSILVTVNVNVGTPIGTLINSSVRIEPVAGDNYPGCNYAYWEIYTTGAVDPNAILVDRDTVLTTELSSPPYLNYIIYFQNTGNDTAFNARVLNNIPQTLDVNSFEFVAASHPMNITYGAHSRLLTFTFDNILLPDSGANEPGSHGFIRYKIKPLSTLVAGDQVKNNAAIYFDFNQPVMTNTAVTEIVLPTGAEEFEVQSLKFKVFPNPVRNELEIINPQQGDKTKYEITISDITGRLNLRLREAKLPAKLDVSKFAAGIYFLVINDRNTFFRTKVVKQ